MASILQRKWKGRRLYETAGSSIKQCLKTGSEQPRKVVEEKID